MRYQWLGKSSRITFGLVIYEGRRKSQFAGILLYLVLYMYESCAMDGHEYDPSNSL